MTTAEPSISTLADVPTRAEDVTPDRMVRALYVWAQVYHVRIMEAPNVSDAIAAYAGAVYGYNTAAVLLRRLADVDESAARDAAVTIWHHWDDPQGASEIRWEYLHELSAGLPDAIEAAVIRAISASEVTA